ncbi:SCAN domain-containing protein 3 [Trichonephila clavipes]|nr:SCAN domain-containing protein 3 [Trichonephila clavipes]
MFVDNFAKELQSIPLSNDTVSRRIDDIAEDVEQQLFGKLRDKLFSIQLDEATDSNKDAHFIAYVRFWDGQLLIIANAYTFCIQSNGGRVINPSAAKTSSDKGDINCSVTHPIFCTRIPNVALRSIMSCSQNPCCDTWFRQKAVIILSAHPTSTNWLFV